MSYETPEPSYSRQPPARPRRRPAWLLWLLLLLIAAAGGALALGVLGIRRRRGTGRFG